MTTGTFSPGRAKIDAKTLRTDRWWLQPLVTFLALLGFVVYGIVRAFMNKWYYVANDHYLAPFYSPCLTKSCVAGASDFGQPFPAWRFLTPAMLILVFPGGFRFTCYYYRKAYYRAFWMSPPACAVAEPHAKYTGETRFPLIFQNIHRYFFYAAIVVAAILTFDAVKAFRGHDGGFGIGLGTLILVANVVLIWMYTASCHSCRSIVGGRLTHFSKHPVRYKLWTWVSKLNARHQQLAWFSLVSVLVADIYVMLVASGAFADPRLFN